jgi:hypothetical protein
VPTDTGVGTLSREVPVGLLGRVALADEGPDGLVDDRQLGKACRGARFGSGWQVLIEDEVSQGPGGEPREVRGEVDKGSRRGAGRGLLAEASTLRATRTLTSATRGCSGCRDLTGLKLAQRGPQPVTFAGAGFDTEALANALTDSEFQFRMGFGRVVGGGLEELVRDRELEDCPERLHVLVR